MDFNFFGTEIGMRGCLHNFSTSELRYMTAAEINRLSN